MGSIGPLRLDPEAAKNLDQKAEGLLGLISAAPIRDQNQRGFGPDIQPRAHLTEKDIVGEVKIGLSDYRGREIGRFFDHGGSTVGLVGQGFKELQSLAERLQRTRSICPYVSVQCIVDCGFEWMKSRYQGGCRDSFTDFVLRESGRVATTNRRFDSSWVLLRLSRRGNS